MLVAIPGRLSEAYLLLFTFTIYYLFCYNKYIIIFFQFILLSSIYYT